MSNNYEWKKLKNLPVKLDMHTQATIGDDIYVFGGRIDTSLRDGPVDTLYKYNITSDTWSQIPKSGTWPNAKYGHVMTSINGKLYVTGGYTGTAYDNTTWEFDPLTNQWSAKTAMPVYKYLATAGAINNEMIVIGGSTGTNALQNTNYAYNPTNNTWRNYTPSQSFDRHAPASAVVNDIMYIYGGSDASGAVQSYFLHVIENANISRKEDHGPARWYHTGVKYKDSMYSLFGYTNQAQTIEAPCEEYNTLTETWSIVPDSPSKRRLAAASSVSNGFVVTGGSVVSGQFLDEVWFYGETEETPPEKDYTITWKKGADIPVTSLYYHASASVGNDVYVFGGRKNGNALVIVTNDLWKYSTEDDTWELLTTPSPKPSPRNGHMMVSINHLLYVIGGYDVNGQQSNETWEYNTLTNVWTQKQNFVNNSPNGSAVIRNGKIVVVISIANASMTVEEYDPSTDTWSTITSFGNSNTIPDNPFGLAIDNDNFIWICGGRKRSPIPAPTNTYVITPDNQLVDMGSHPPPRDFNAATFFNGKYYTYGGGQSNVYSADLSNSRFESFNRMTNEWENLSEESPILRDVVGSALSGNKFIVTGGRFLQSGTPVYTNETWIAEFEKADFPDPEEWGYTEYTETTEVIVPERARYMRTVAVGSGGQGRGSGGGALTAGYVPVTPGETLWLEINNNYSIVSAIRDGGKKVVIGASAATNSLGGLKWSESDHLLAFNPLHYAIITSEWAGSNASSLEITRYCNAPGTNRVRYWMGGAAAGYNANGNAINTNGGRNGGYGDVGCVGGYYNYQGDGGGGVGLNGDVDSPKTPSSRGRGGSGGEDGIAYNSTPNSGKGGKYGGGNGSSYSTPTNNGGISIKWLSAYDVDETFNDSKVSVSYNNDDEITDYRSSFDSSIIDISDYGDPLSDINNTIIDVSDSASPVGIDANKGKITQVIKEKSRGRKVNHSTVDVSGHGDLQIRTNEAYLVASDEHEGFTNIYNKSIVTLSDKGELQIKSNYMWAEVSFNGIKYSKEFRLRETTPNTVTLSPIYDVEYDFIGIYPSDDTYDCEVFVNGVLQDKGEGKYFKLLLGDTIQFRITSPNPGETKFVAINGDNILNIICPSKYGNYPDFLDFGEFTETFPNFWYETGELIIDGLYPLDSYSEIYVNNVRVWMVINDGEPTNRVSVTNGDRIKLVFKGSSPTELPEGETYKIYHDNDRGTYDVGQVVVKSIVVEGSETRQDIKFFLDMIILKTVTERQQLLLDSDYNHYQRTNHNSKNDFEFDIQHGIHDQDVTYIWDKTSIFENIPNEYILDKTSIFENVTNEYIWDKTSIYWNIPNDYDITTTSIYESEEQSYDVLDTSHHLFDEYDTDVIHSIKIPIGVDFSKGVTDIKFGIDTTGVVDNNKSQYFIDHSYEMYTQSIRYGIDNVYETVTGKDGNIYINAVDWIRNVHDVSIEIDHVYNYYDIGIPNEIIADYENNTTIGKYYIDAIYRHDVFNQYYFEGSYSHILQAVQIPIDDVFDTNQTERWPTEAQEWEAVKVEYPAFADMVYYHLVKYNPQHIINTDFQIYIHTESKDVDGEYEEGTQHNNYKIDIVTDKGTSFVGYNFSGLYEKTEVNYHPVVTDKSLMVIGNSQVHVEGNDFEFVRDPVWQTDLIENLSGWHTKEKAIEYAQSLNLSENEIELFEYNGRWGFTTDPELVVRDCSLPYPIIMIDKVIFWSH